MASMQYSIYMFRRKLLLIHQQYDYITLFSYKCLETLAIKRAKPLTKKHLNIYACKDHLSCFSVFLLS